MPTDTVVLDTHALLWWQARSELLSEPARAAIERAGQVLVTPITYWEIATLIAKGRIAIDRPLRDWVRDLESAPGPVASVAVDADIAVTAGLLEDFHGDPADRIIYATALTGRHPIVTKDRRLRHRAADDGVIVIW